MSRHNYVDDFDLDYWALIRYRGAVASAIRGSRGQAFLRELAAALDAMPDKSLIAHELYRDGEVCAIGAVLQARGIPSEEIERMDPEEYDRIAKDSGIAESMAREIMYENDDYQPWPHTKGAGAERRWQYMRKWVERQLIEEK